MVYNETNAIEWIINYFNKNLGGCPELDENWNESNYNLEENFAKFIKLSEDPLISVRPDSRNTEKNIITISVPILPIQYQISTNYFDSNEWINTSSSLTYENYVSNKEPDFMTVEELQEFIQKINWKKLFDYIFEDVDFYKKPDIDSQTLIMISDKNKLLEFFKVNKTECFESVLANYFCKSFSVSTLANINITSSLDILDVIGQYTYFLDYIYYQHVKDDKNPDLVRQITGHIREFMSDSLFNKTWLNSERKTEVNEKIKEMVITTDFPGFVKHDDSFMKYYRNVSIAMNTGSTILFLLTLKFYIIY
ncbi:uncharacterized protein [Centruroides vittatus]|uniref:uncharacterized protein n=1 Tax=Centruroides vittatus TaxID=120091 RepID=UPI00350F59A2